MTNELFCQECGLGILASDLQPPTSDIRPLSFPVLYLSMPMKSFKIFVQPFFKIPKDKIIIDQKTVTIEKE